MPVNTRGVDMRQHWLPEKLPALRSCAFRCMHTNSDTVIMNSKKNEVCIDSFKLDYITNMKSCNLPVNSSNLYHQSIHRYL